MVTRPATTGQRKPRMMVTSRLTRRSDPLRSDGHCLRKAPILARIHPTLNASGFAGSARVRLYFEDGTTAERVFALLARSRTNVSVSVEFPEAVGKRFGALIESLGPAPAQVVVERAMYTSPGGVTWAAGTNALATPVP